MGMEGSYHIAQVGGYYDQPFGVDGYYDQPFGVGDYISEYFSTEGLSGLLNGLGDILAGPVQGRMKRAKRLRRLAKRKSREAVRTRLRGMISSMKIRRDFIKGHIRFADKAVIKANKRVTRIKNKMLKGRDRRIWNAMVLQGAVNELLAVTETQKSLLAWLLAVDKRIDQIRGILKII